MFSPYLTSLLTELVPFRVTPFTATVPAPSFVSIPPVAPASADLTLAFADIDDANDAHDAHVVMNVDLRLPSSLPPLLNINSSCSQLPIIPKSRFIPIRPFGTGTFATVYEALDTETGSLVAMKKIYGAQGWSLDTVRLKTLKTSIEREIDFLTRLREHKNVVTIYGHGVDEHFWYIYMELVAGGSLFSLIQSIGPLEEPLIRRLIRQIVNGLVHLHSVGIIHRDIKTKNILLAIDGTVKLADFGAACQIRLNDSMNGMMNVSANFSYTPLYVAPEVISENKYDTKVDIWALGCVLVEMASGLEPWAEKRFQNAYQCLKTIAEKDEIPKIPSTLSADGIDFVTKCLDRNPTTRPTAVNLLSHPFLTKGIPSSPSLECINL